MARILADDDKREEYPLYDGLFAYFPAALLEIARWSKVGNDKHNPGEPIHWAREKSTDHENKILRHLIDARETTNGDFIEAVPLAWRALALLQTLLEEKGWASGPNGQWLKDKNEESSSAQGVLTKEEINRRVALFDKQFPGAIARDTFIEETQRTEGPQEGSFSTEGPNEDRAVRSVPRVEQRKVLGIPPVWTQSESEPLASEVRGQGFSEAGVLGN